MGKKCQVRHLLSGKSQSGPFSLGDMCQLAQLFHCQVDDPIPSDVPIPLPDGALTGSSVSNEESEEGGKEAAAKQAKKTHIGGKCKEAAGKDVAGKGEGGKGNPTKTTETTPGIMPVRVE